MIPEERGQKGENEEAFFLIDERIDLLILLYTSRHTGLDFLTSAF